MKNAFAGGLPGLEAQGTAASFLCISLSLSLSLSLSPHRTDCRARASSTARASGQYQPPSFLAGVEEDTRSSTLVCATRPIFVSHAVPTVPTSRLQRCLDLPTTRPPDLPPKHFQRLAERSGVAFGDMIFFDDYTANIGDVLNCSVRSCNISMPWNGME